MLDYIALALLIFVAIVIFYGIIAIHDIPYEIAKSRQHPQQDAIHIAGWISLFTLHVIWPFLWIWATLYRPDRGWGFIDNTEEKAIISQLVLLTEQQHIKLEKIESEYKTKTESFIKDIHDLKTQLALIAAKEDKENKDTP